MAVNTNTVNQSIKVTAGPSKDTHQDSTNYLKLQVETVIESRLNHRRATKEVSIAFNHDWVKTRHAVCRIMSQSYPTFLNGEQFKLAGSFRLR